MPKIKIILKSDLCAGNGESNGNSIDTDICTDEFGFPYIPGRRIKGCLKDSAILLKKYGDEISGDKTIKSLFGDKKGNPGCLKIGNAYMENIDSMKSCIRSMKEGNDKLQPYLRPNSIVSLFTSVRGNTKIDENGIADNGSLRYTRVINQYSPFDEREMCFVANVRVSKEDEELLERCCKATRHIGSNRNRGLGNVKIEFIAENSNCDASNEANNAVKIEYKNSKNNGRVCISYTISLDEPVTLPGNDEQLTSIPSRSVIGCMAREYLKHGKAEDETFKNLFLNGKCKWTSLNPMIDGKRSDPAPLYMVRTPNRFKENEEEANENNKKEKIEYTNLFNEEYHEKVKSLERYYAIKKDDGYKLCDTDYHTVYHHSKEGDGELYMQTSLDRGMIYGGEVYTDSDVADEVVQLLEKARIAFGRSKSAQYSGCTLRNGMVNDANEDAVEIKSGEEFYVVLKSDMVLAKDGIYCCGAKDFEEELSAKFSKLKKSDVKLKLKSAFCRYHVVSGYQAMWQLQKPQVRTARGGSSYCFETSGEFEPLFTDRIGLTDHNGLFLQEGFGMFEIITKEDMSKIKDISMVHADKYAYAGLDNDDVFKGAIIVKAAEELLRQRASIALKELEKDKVNLKHSSIGRLRNMLSNAKEYKDLLEMIDNVKESDKNSGINKTRKESLEEIIKKVYGEQSYKNKELDREWLLTKNNDNNEEIYLLSKTNKYAANKVESMWKEPLWILVHNLYYNIGGK